MLTMLPDNIVLGCLVVFALRVADVSLGTLRTVYILQGRRLLAACIGFFEVLIWIFVVSSVVGAITDWVLMVAYALGFATGTWVGLSLERRFAIGFTQLRVISDDNGENIAQALWEEDFGATVVKGHGKNGAVDLVFSIVPRRWLKRCVYLATQADSDCFISVSDSRYLFRGYMGQGKK